MDDGEREVEADSIILATGLALVGLGMAPLPVAAILALAILVMGTTVLLDFAKRTFQGHLDGTGSPSPT